MKFAVIGVGGVGGFFGGLLAHNGEDVTFVARGEHFTALRKEGLTLKSVGVNFEKLPVSVVDSIGQIAQPDVIFIATKTYDRDEVAEQLSHCITDETVIISLLNGIDNDILIKKSIPQALVYPGLAYIISERTGYGTIEQTAGPCTIFFGERGVSENSRLKEIETIMKRAGILATASPDIEQELWAKFLWITAFAGMTGICRSDIGTIVNDESAFELLVRCLDEGIAVAQAMGIAINDETRSKIIEKSEKYRSSGSHAKSSLLVDIENHRRTEIDSLNGAIVRLGKATGIRVPTHEMIYHSIKLGSEYYLTRSKK